MKEAPILFSAPMVRAILAGQKTQTRRIVHTRHPLEMIGPRGTADDPESWGWFFDGPDHHGWAVLARGKREQFDNGMISIPSPYGEPGDRLWVRETWARTDGRYATTPVAYRADDERPLGVFKWTPSIFMPRDVSRITLEVLDVRVERLQAITEADARAEGVEPDFGNAHTCASRDYRRSYERLWDTINAKRAPWASDPWVWVVDFRVADSEKEKT